MKVQELISKGLVSKGLKQFFLVEGIETLEELGKMVEKGTIVPVVLNMRAYGRGLVRYERPKNVVTTRKIYREIQEVLKYFG